MRIIPALAAALAVATLAGCGGDDAGSDDGDAAVSVVAALAPLAHVAELVGGDRAAVDSVTPAGAEPHDVELSPDQVADIEDADVVVVIGGGFQPEVEEVA